MNDELWNLNADGFLSKFIKSNKLPKWDPFFTVFAENQYDMYNLIYERGLANGLGACYTEIICIPFGQDRGCIGREF